jgi:NADH dehydrogenase
VATAALSPGDIASPIRWVLRRQRNAEVLLGEVVRFDTDRDIAVLSDGTEFHYDYAIVATGATHAYFGHDAWQAHAPGLKTLEDALVIRRRVLMAFERAERETDPEKRRTLLTFVIVGGGPTGVELAGALAEISRQSLARDFRHFDPTAATIVLLEGGPALLAAFPPPLQERARRDLEQLGVQVHTGSVVTGVEAEAVLIGAKRIPAATILWAAGVAASPLGRALGAPTDRAGRVLVNPDLTVPGCPNVFVVGDLASLTDEQGHPLPGVAQVAVQMGGHAAHNIMRRIANQPLRPFRYRDYGNMATIGRAKAVADLHWLRLQGLIGWLAWVFIHLIKLIGFRNRVVVMVQWAWAYFSYERSVRLITGSPRADD